MKKTLFSFIFAFVLSINSFAGDSMSVQTKEAHVRTKASFLGKILAELKHTDVVDVQEETKGWMKVTTSDGVTGWIHASALSTKKIKLKAGKNTTRNSGTSQEEIALAGKGFTKGEERDRIKRGNTYGWVIQMENLKPTDEDIQSFIEAGGLGK